MSNSSNSPASNSETITVSNTTTLLNINMTNVTKLTSSNFLMWSRQVHTLLDGYDLTGHIDGSVVVPPATITGADGVVNNPAYVLWKRQDRLIYSSLLGAITVTLQPLLSTAATAADIWTTLTTTYAKPSRGHVKQLRQQLDNWKKGSKPIDEYFQGLTTRFDQLALLGKAMDHEDQIERILDGLPEEYKTVSDQIEGRDTPPSLSEIHEKLLNHEAKLQNVASPAVSVPVTANFTNSRGSSGNNRNNTNTRRGDYRGTQSPQPQHFNSNSQSRGYQGRCQICSVYGHSARRCPQLQGGGSSYMNQQQSAPVSNSWQPRANVAHTAFYNPNTWLLDSGATHHLTSDLNNLPLHQPYHGGDEVAIADGSGLQITHTGSASISTPSKTLKLQDVLCVPSVHKNLISVYRLCNANQVSVEFFPASFQLKDLSTGVRLLQGRTKDDLYEWPVPKPNLAASYATYPDTKTSISQWDNRLGHPSSAILKSVVSKFSLPCFDVSTAISPCNNCLLNKTQKLPFHQSSIVSSKPLEYIFSDVWQSPILSTQNFKYYLLLVDHFTRYSWLFPLKAKSDVKEIFIKFKPLVETKFQTKIQTLYSDNGGDYLDLRQFLSTHGITHLTTPPHTPEHNGLSERKHRHVVETGLSLLCSANMPLPYWPLAFATAVFLINRLPTPVLSNLSPYQSLFNLTPNYQKLRTFGCLCFPWLRPYVPNKLENRSTPCIFVGYSLTQSAYLCLEPLSGRIYVSRHVRFNETEYPFPQMLRPTQPPQPTPSPSSTSPPYTTIPIPSSLIQSPVPVLSSPPSSRDSSPSSSPSVPAASSSSSDRASVPAPSPVPESSATSTSSTSVAASLPATVVPDSPPQPAPQAAPQEAPRHSMTTRSRNNIVKPVTKYNLTATLESDPHWIPATWQQAIKHAHWRKAMSNEFTSTTDNYTWDLVAATERMNIVGCRWVFTIK